MATTVICKLLNISLSNEPESFTEGARFAP